MSNATCQIRPRLLVFGVCFCRVKDHRNMLHDSPLLKNTSVKTSSVRQVIYRAISSVDTQFDTPSFNIIKLRTNETRKGNNDQDKGSEQISKSLHDQSAHVIIQYTMLSPGPGHVSFSYKLDSYANDVFCVFCCLYVAYDII